MYVTDPNNASPTMNPTEHDTMKVRLANSGSGRIGSAARCSIAG